MLQLLLKYAAENLEPEPGFASKDVRWAVICGQDGKYQGVIELGDVNTEKNLGTTFPKCPDLSQPELVLGSTTKCHFLVETAKVVMLFDPAKKDSDYITPDEGSHAKHEFFVSLLRQAALEMSQLMTVADCISNQDVIKQACRDLKRQKAQANDKVTFRIGNAFPVESHQWHEWWRNFRKNLADTKSEKRIKKAGPKKTATGVMRCFASGELVEPLLTHPKIKGLEKVGGLQSGDALIGFDKDAFCSYDLQQSANAAVSEQAATAYRDALNHLIKKNGHVLAGMKIVHWFKEKIEPPDDPLSWLQDDPNLQKASAEERARELLDSIRTGKRIDLLNNRYYALTLSGAAGRVMVRDWMEGAFEELVENVSCWFDDLAIVDCFGNPPTKSPKLETVLTSLLLPRKHKQEYRDWVASIGPARMGLWQAAIRGTGIPHVVVSRLVPLHNAFVSNGTLEAALNANENVGLFISLLQTRMGLLKAYHTRKHRINGGNLMSGTLKPGLNEDHPSSAYHCGRLMAVLADVQRAALPDVGAGIVQRYYAAASATPALILGRLTRLSQFHLSKLKTPLARWYEKRLSSIWALLGDGPPRTLDLEKQSLFALGYYQQMAFREDKGGQDE
ncbi:type I-C CRISPR-associated protein Cas8c/Csd1 [Desulfomonile tiedjei]|uniref:CRISPR-associated protein Cas8c/Csd1, subtype I-C/DVULG n=1 Tax=Desulfomonile tiedjei (strain ATCC 49306 / DSM 6799 / DCB-1) TaxID=706587 RepID=I4C1S9_DESTA|nr:type I-C CRISPR-associated protein Cas8c/Csd1 [Desulfomonile tiedjei]AFM23520.1 CRISPR-associated protein Cas8c/Csd1, subtype I-C/DVULG [Desulfomonile tiedjei DSM 6799]